MPRPDLIDRNISIAKDFQSKVPPGEIARKHNLSVAHVYRARDAGLKVLEKFEAQSPLGGQAVISPMAPNPRSNVRENLYRELALTGLRRFGGRVDDEYERAFKLLYKRIQTYREMGDDAVIASVLQAIKMVLRRVTWYVQPNGETDADKAAAEWLETCMSDMSQTWTDTIDQALGMVQYGFQLAEEVYKRRLGPQPDDESEDAKPSSKYDDGRIGWRKWTFIAPESLLPGNEWLFDDTGGIQGFNQLAPPFYKAVFVPIQKSILFRTTTEKNNPEGRSILRGMWQTYYYKSNFSEIEGISAERMGAGLPVIYMGSDTAKNIDDPNSDAAQFQNIVRNIRVDEQMGLLVPYAKMGAGAEPGRGVLVELLSPPTRGIVNFHETIVRLEQRMAMVGLAQFTMLGMSKIGTQALAEVQGDFFSMAIDAWSDSIRETINRYAVERLFLLNDFPGITAYPTIEHEVVGKVSLEAMADYVNKLAGAALITPGPELETFLREIADLPEKPAVLESEFPGQEEKESIDIENAPGEGTSAPDMTESIKTEKSGAPPQGENVPKKPATASVTAAPEIFQALITELRAARLALAGEQQSNHERPR